MLETKRRMQMIKGTQRQMVIMHTSDSELFEMAYFVLRSDVRSSDQKSMIDEANNIVSSVCADKKRSKRERRKSLARLALLFASGAAVGALVLVGVFYLSGF